MLRRISPACSSSTDDTATTLIGLAVAGVVIAADAERRQQSHEAPTTYYDVVYVHPDSAKATPASPRDRIVSNEGTRPPFDMGAARRALAEVDLSECRAAGAPRGYGHANVSFNPDGLASKVGVDAPSGLSESAVSCIGDRLGAVTLAAYEGSFVTVGTTWFIR